MLDPHAFKCGRCGQCCIKLTVWLYKEDIGRIKERFDENYFAEKSLLDGNPVLVLKKNKDGCVFLEKRRGKYSCKIYGIRPKICVQYPFFGKGLEDCKPRGNFQ